mmetsp:Transcript_3762/g.5663  ORF Transcript_3762/g.5663 Transcript_3762/m.5663 type:complete len:391 (+) Transcript_3762:730-1902(+)
MDVFNLHIRTDPTHSNMHSKSVKPNTCPPTFSPSSRTSKLETLLQDPKIVENGSLPPPVPLQPTDVLLRTAKPMRRASAERKHRVLLASNRRVQDVLGRVYVFRGRFVRYGLKDLRYDVLQRGYLRCVSSRTETDQKLLDTRAQAVQAVKEEVQAEDVVKGVEDQEMQTDVVKEEVQAKDVVKGVQTDVVKEREEVKHGETCTKLSPVVQNSLRGEEGGVDSNKTAEGRQGGHPLTSPTGFRPASKSSPRYNQDRKTGRFGKSRFFTLSRSSSLRHRGQFFGPQRSQTWRRSAAGRQTRDLQNRRPIPAAVKNAVWDRWNGRLGFAPCFCCRRQEIRMSSFHCGHVVARSRGGSDSVENLRPICQACNSSMGSCNMAVFIERFGLHSNVV